jgi:HK97 family phage portal protein
VTTLQTADGRLLRAQRPAGAGVTAGGFFPSSFPPMWSNGEREGEDAYLKSFEAIYRSQPVLSGVVDKLTRRIATLPLIAYQKKGKAREATEGDSLDTLIRKPMPRRSTVHLVSHIAQSLLIHGNAVVAKVRLNGPDKPPNWLWPLDWAHLSAYGQPGGTIEWWSTTQFGAEERFIAAEDTVHFAWPGPDGGEIGVSPLEKLGTTIRIEDAAQRHQASSFKNGIRPSAGVSVDDPNPTKQKLDLAAEIVRAAHGGLDKAGGWVFTGANTKITPLSLSPVEAALIDQRKLNREEVGMVYDMSGPLMNDLEHGTYSNVSEMLRSLYRDVVPPWTELIVQTKQTQLIDTEPAWLDRFVRFDFSDKLKGDPTEQAAVDRSDVEAGIRTRDEARDGRGLAPMGGPASELTANVNNQAPVTAMSGTGAAPTGSPPS